MRHALIALGLLAFTLPALAEDAPAPAPEPAAKPDETMRPRRPAPAQPDLSRSVTLSGVELQLLVAAVKAEGAAQSAAQAAAPVTAKITEALTPPPADKK